MSGSDGPQGKGRAAVVGFLVCASPASVAADGSLAARQAVTGTPAIPEPGFAPGWAKAGQLRTFTGQDLFNQIDGGAELFLEFGFAKLRLQAYARDKAELTLNAYEMESAASALGVYLMKMGRETPFPEIAARNSGEEVQVTILKGRYFIQVPYAGEAQAVSVYDNLLANLDPYLKVLGTRERAFVFEDHHGKFGIVERKGSNLDIRVSLDLRPKL